MYPEHGSSASSPAAEAPSHGAACEHQRCGHHHFHGHHHQRQHRLNAVIMGLTVVAWGALLFLSDLGHLPRGVHALDLWPLLLVGFGLARAIGRRTFGAVAFGLVAAFVGASLLADRLGLAAVHTAHLWPLLVVAAGLALLWRGLARHHPHALTADDETVSAGALQRSVTMGALKLVVDSPEFHAGTLSATMGGVEVDLRRASIPGEEATIDLALVMSGVELYVPGDWQVVSELSMFMGAVEDETTARGAGAGPRKRLVLRGSATMSAVTVRN